MIMRSSKSMLVRLYCQLVVTLLLALLIEEPSSRLVNGQLEAVGAVLSVVPVTSILATAGLVGVKLAALSRLLNILGYDRAYLAQNLGTGTAAAPIGLQTRYAYMFPYVPGLNISVKGEDSIGMPKGAGGEMVAGDGTKMVATGQSDQSSGAMGPGAVVTMNGPPRRKTYPAMSLPAEYESQQKPFRGAEALKSIFGKAGLQVHIPTVEQQQQLQQKFELPTQGKDQNNNYYSNNYQQLAEHSVGNMHHFSEATTNTNDNDPNRNDKQPQLSSHILQQQPTYQDQLSTTTNDQQQQQLQQQQPPPLTNANNNNYQIDGSQQPPLRHDTLSGVGGSLLSNRRPLHNSVVPSNVTPNRGGGPMEPSSPPLSPQQPPPPLTTMHSDGANHDAITATGLALATGDDQLANKPSSLNSHQNHQPNQPPTSSSSNSNQSPSGRDQAAAGTATQVNMPHPHYNTHFLVNQQQQQQQQQQQPPQSQLLPARPMVLPLPLPGPVIDLSAGDAAAGVLRGHLSAGGDTGTGGASGSGPPHANEVEPAMGDNNDMAGRPHSAGGGSLSSLHYEQHAVIPQRDLFAFMARQRWSGMNAGAALGLANSPGPQQAPLTMGHLSRPEPGGQGPGGQVTPAIQAIQLIPSASLASRPHNGGMTQPHQFFSSAAVPDSFKPARHPELISQQHNSLHHNPQLSSNQNKNLNLNNQNNQLQNQNQFNPHHQHHHPTVASQGAGFSPLPNEMTSTNFFPRPFDIDDSPTLIGDRSNELDRTQPNRRRRRRRRKRSPGSTPFASLPDPVLSSSGHHQQRTAPLQPAQPGSKLTPTNRGDGSQQRKQPAKSGQKQHTGRPAGATFGMPVSNINTLKKRRRRRQVRLFSLSNSQFLD